MCISPGRKRWLLLAALLLTTSALSAQTTLTADGQTDTYTLIQNVLGASPEVPDCSHPDFGPHITQASDAALGKPVFLFHIHVTPDNDRCTNFDRQRNEIKTDSGSPSSLKGFLNDTVNYRWKFKLDSGFQPSPNFTHIHQIKAGDGDAGAPIITLTPRSGSPDILEIIHSTGTGGITETLTSTALAPFKGVWVEANETVKYSHTGTYSIQLRRVSDGALLLSYSNGNIDLWRDMGTTFARPKWGIYRSLNSTSFLRDEIVRFNNFCIAKAANCPADRLPPLWKDQDIGSPALAGTASFSNGTFTVKAGGTDIWSTSDQFHYVYLSQSGDFNITARVASEQNTSAWAKAGVMVRASTAANSAFVDVFVTPSNGVNMQYRSSTGGSAVQLARITAPVAPYWVRLVRSGNTFTGFASSDGSAWSSLGSVNIGMSSTVTTGLALTSHNSGSLNTSTFDHVWVDPCVVAAADGSWYNTAFNSQSGTFTATFDATPSISPISSAVGLSLGAQTSFTGFANLVIFTTTGEIQARNGSTYAALSSIPYAAGVTYHFRLAVDVPSHTYSIFVTAPGGSEQTVGSNYDFRTEQNTVPSLDNWGALSNTSPGGTLSVCSFEAQ
jgi:regulation of enolase protein 1 (concanavalin A-like superfamily)